MLSFSLSFFRVTIYIKTAKKPTDYLRLKSLTLGLTAPGNWVSRFGLSKARFYFAASNLLTWKSKDLTVDPEMRVDGVCTFQTPALRTFTFGLELGF